MSQRTYNADDIQEKSDADHVRTRTRMYLGEDAYNTAGRELVDNAGDEIAAGFGRHVEVEIFADGSLGVYDSGRGVPPDYDSNGKSGILKSLGSLNAGGKFDQEAYGGTATGGMNGVGGSGANFISSRFDVRVYRDEKEHYLAFKEGMPGHFAGDDFNPGAPFTEGDNVKVSKDTRPAEEKERFPHGTRLRLQFDKTLPLDEDFEPQRLLKRTRYYPYLIPQMKLTLRTPDGEEHYDGETLGGVEGLLNDHLLAPENTLGESVISLEGVAHFQRSVPGAGKKESVPVRFDFAIGWDVKSYEPNVISFGNTIMTPDNGVHVDALASALETVVNDRAKQLKLLRAGEVIAERDILEGARMVVRVQLNDPPFEGQDKHIMKGAALKKALVEAYTTALKRFFTTRQNSTFTEKIARRAHDAARVRANQEIAKKNARQRNAAKAQGMFMTMPSKFRASSQMGPGEGAELYIAEGDSAASTIVAARDADYQAVYGVKGKILNTYGITSASAMKNGEVADIVHIIGAGIGKSFNVDECQFDRIIIATDADFDGLHICVLLLTLFQSQFPGLIESGRVFVAMPPLFSIFTKDETLYAVNKGERDAIIADLDKRKVKYKIGRNKGLGEMPAEEFWHTVLNPETRAIKSIQMDEERDDVKGLMDMFFGKGKDAVLDRKKWVFDISSTYNFDELDL